jgi:hypothetical protein
MRQIPSGSLFLKYVKIFPNNNKYRPFLLISIASGRNCNRHPNLVLGSVIDDKATINTETVVSQDYSRQDFWK